MLSFPSFLQGEEQSVLLTEYLEGGELFQRISSKDYELTEAKCREGVTALCPMSMHSHADFFCIQGDPGGTITITIKLKNCCSILSHIRG